MIARDYAHFVLSRFTVYVFDNYVIYAKMRTTLDNYMYGGERGGGGYVEYGETKSRRLDNFQSRPHRTI